MRIEVLDFLCARAIEPGDLAPIIFKAILVLYCNGYTSISAAMIRNTCNELVPGTLWAQRIPAICNAMRHVREVGGGVAEENDHVEFRVYL